MNFENIPSEETGLSATARWGGSRTVSEPLFTAYCQACFDAYARGTEQDVLSVVRF
jgi:hypothetical protein